MEVGSYDQHPSMKIIYRRLITMVLERAMACKKSERAVISKQVGRKCRDKAEEGVGRW